LNFGTSECVMKSLFV